MHRSMVMYEKWENKKVKIPNSTKDRFDSSKQKKYKQQVVQLLIGSNIDEDEKWE